MAKETKTFWHLSDLHLERACAPRCGRKSTACDKCIKAALLEQLAKELTARPPDLVLLAGDIFDDDGWKSADNALEPLVKAASRRGVVIAGVRGQHDPSSSALRQRYPWVLKSHETNIESGIFITGVPADDGPGDAKRQAARTMRAFFDAPTPLVHAPSILLAHVNAANFPPSERAAPRFNYYALGDMHLSRIVRLSERAVVGTPGHSYSYFDGSGKAWPTFLLKGSISPTGHVDVQREPLQGGRRAPAIRQLYVRHRFGNRAAGELVFVNAPEADILGRIARALPDVEELTASGKDLQDLSLRRATFRYRTRAELTELVRRIASELPSDVFVGLATGNGKNKQRWRAYGKSILAPDQLPNFVADLCMRGPKTQTSDAEGWCQP